MSRNVARRLNLSFDALEGRQLQSGFTAPSPLAGTASLLPYVEQENVQPAVSNPKSGEGNQIIAILIG